MSENQKYLIWSNEHNAWWASNAVGGYSKSIEFARRYNRATALEICNYANRAWDVSDTGPDELPIEESIALSLTPQKGLKELL